MPLGDAITKDFQWQLVDQLYGCGEGNAHLEYGKSIEGLGVPDVKTQDVVYNGLEGSYGNPDRNGVRVVTIPVLLRATDEVTVMTALKNLYFAWQPVSADVDLAFQLPGWGKFLLLGRPRGFTVDLTRERVGAVHALLRFDCLNPSITFL